MFQLQRYDNYYSWFTRRKIICSHTIDLTLNVFAYANLEFATVWNWTLGCSHPCNLLKLQVRGHDHIRWHHGPRRGPTKASRRKNPGILFLRIVLNHFSPSSIWLTFMVQKISIKFRNKWVVENAAYLTTMPKTCTFCWGQTKIWSKFLVVRMPLSNSTEHPCAIDV